jgi:DNA-directed RNA polymerase specialized sigma24 family protein
MWMALNDTDVINLINQYKQGNIHESGSGQLWKHLSKVAFGYAFSMLRDHNCKEDRYEIAKDISQDAVMRAFKALNNFTGNKYRGWFNTIVRNLVIDHFRKCSVLQPTPPPSQPPDCRIQILNECMDTLTVEQRLIIEYTMDGLSSKEIAEKLGLPSANAVDQQRSLAKKKLKDCIEKRLRE